MINELMLNRIIKALILLAICVFVYLYFSAFLPILLALLTAMIVEPFVRFVQRKLEAESRLLPVFIVFTTFIVVWFFILYLSLTKMAKSIYVWALNLPKYAVQIQQYIDQFIVRFYQFIEEIPQGYLIVLELEKQSDRLTNGVIQFTTQLINALGTWLQTIPNLLFVTLIYFITFFLISLDFPALVHLFFSFFKEETANKLRYVFQQMNKVFLGYWKAQFILSIGVFVITYISLLFIAPNVAFIMSFIIWVVDIIPLYVGPAIILVPWGIFAIVLGSSSTGVKLIVLAVVLLILRRIIEPKVLGDSIGLAVLPTVLTMYFGFVFFGMIGLILGPFVYIAIRTAKEGGVFEFK